MKSGMNKQKTKNKRFSFNISIIALNTNSLNVSHKRA